MTKEEFIESMQLLNNLLPKHAQLKNPIEVNVYYNSLKDLTKEALSQAIGDILLNQKSFYNFPTIRELREISYKFDKNAILLNKVFQKLLLDSIIYKDKPDFYHPYIEASLVHIGGWHILKQIQENEEEKNNKRYQFITFYMQNFLNQKKDKK